MDIDYTNILEYLLTASGAFAWLSALLNGEYTNKYVKAIVKVINVIGGNVWKAANKTTTAE